MATIEMELQVRTEIGIAPSEQGRVQDLKVLLTVEVADTYSDAAAQEGDLTLTLDYGRLREIVHEVFAERRYSLLEEVTTTIRERMRQLSHVTSARVAITKHHPWVDVPRLTLTR
ncbi:dihydroneopterin aldolase [Variovorax sp. dw_954]|uniref:dihydroneopterin aldolase n=1 Tax=Variovorax sp. dw_954 TaxID=2720078 RepID=UPI001BD6390B|nr:dihydroneopterin aldolase [Variovorax sp. dw_954]